MSFSRKQQGSAPGSGMARARGLNLWLSCLIVLTCLAVLALASSAGSGAFAESSPSTSTDGKLQAGQGRVGLPPGEYEVTLITGDVVTLRVWPDGRNTINARPALRPDGSTPAIQVIDQDGVLYAVPDDVRPYLHSDLDRELFNVTYLVENGYADDKTERLPVIVEYAREASEPQLVDQTEALPGSTKPTVGLGSVNGAGVGLTKAKLRGFWARISPKSASNDQAPASSPPRLGAGVEKVWLDRKVTVDLNESVPLIGAPEAWAAGFDGTGVKVAVLDTGIDETHADVTGKVVASQSFVPGETVADGHGHGTHVAATIAGTGAAQGGTYKGVAPEAQLVIGKVLENSGSGTTAGVIEGMEWATREQGADVVSMSLGGGPTDGTDPSSQAVNTLTEETGALFVIAAGNSGPRSRTVNTPGAADAALTVAAVDKSDQLANFSSRGPRVGDGALKPDIAAPGVGIVAARAAGTSLGTPVNDLYTRASGTSMATPHVAGAAAILAQKYPDWTAAELKPALMSTAKDDGYTVYQQGAGRVDVARAVGQDVYATTVSVDFKKIPFDDDAPRTSEITYSNVGDDPVTLALTSDVKTTAGTPAPEGTLTAPSSVTVPGGGTASVDVTVDPGLLDPDQYTGAIVASAPGDTRVTTPVGFGVGVQEFKLSVTIDGMDDSLPFFCNGAWVTFCGVIDVFGVDGDGEGIHTGGFTSGTCLQPNPCSRKRLDYFLPPGTYSATLSLHFKSPGNEGRADSAYLFKPEFTVTSDTEILLDLDDAKPITFDTPKPTEVHAQTFMWNRISTGGSNLGSFRFGAPALWVNPTEPVTKGTFVVSPHWVLGAPQVEGTPPGESPYLYVIKSYDERIPDPPHYTFTKRNLAILDSSVHADEPSEDENWLFATRRPTDPSTIAGINSRDFTTPRTVSLSFGPLYRDALHTVRVDDDADSPGEDAQYVFGEPMRLDVHWYARPIVPGVLQALPPGWWPPLPCSACRQGDFFYPFMWLTSPEGSHERGSVGGQRLDEDGNPEFDAEWHLYRNGEEIPPRVPEEEETR